MSAVLPRGFVEALAARAVREEVLRRTAGLTHQDLPPLSAYTEPEVQRAARTLRRLEAIASIDPLARATAGARSDARRIVWEGMHRAGVRPPWLPPRHLDSGRVTYAQRIAHWAQVTL